MLHPVQHHHLHLDQHRRATAVRRTHHTNVWVFGCLGLRSHARDYSLGLEFTSIGAGTNLERHLEVLPSDLVPVHHTHRLYGTVHVEVLDESVALALASVAIRDDLHALYGTER